MRLIYIFLISAFFIGSYAQAYNLTVTTSGINNPPSSLGLYLGLDNGAGLNLVEQNSVSSNNGTYYFNVSYQNYNNYIIAAISPVFGYYVQNSSYKYGSSGQSVFIGSTEEELSLSNNEVISLVFLPTSSSKKGNNSPIASNWSSSIAMGMQVPNTWSTTAYSLLPNSLNPSLFTGGNDQAPLDTINVYLGNTDSLNPSGGDGYLTLDLAPALNLMAFCAELTANQPSQNPCFPSGVIYSAKGSDGIDVLKETLSTKVAALNFAIVALNAYCMQQAKNLNWEIPLNQTTTSISSDDYQYGVLLINPDFLSFTLQYESAFEGYFNGNISCPNYDESTKFVNYLFNTFTATDANTASTLSKLSQFSNGFKPSKVPLNSLEGSSPITIDLSGKTLLQALNAVMQPSKYALYSIIAAEKEIITTWVYSCWDSYPFDNSTLPTDGTNVYNRYISALNALCRKWAPNIAIGWDCGIYQYTFGSRNLGCSWMHQSPNSASVGATMAQAYQLYASLPALANTDFLYFDLGAYEPFQNTPFNNGWAMNPGACKNWFNFINMITNLYNLPSMLFQIPGGVLPSNDDTFNQSNSSYGSLADYIFGICNPAVKSDLSGLNSSFSNLQMPSSYFDYSGETMSQYMNDDGSGNTYSWKDNSSTLTNLDGLHCIQWGSVNAPTPGFNLKPLLVSDGVVIPSSSLLNTAIKTYRENLSIKN